MRAAAPSTLTVRNGSVFARRLDAMTAEQWRRRGRHPTFKTFDVEFLVEDMVHHEAHHVYQMFMRRVPLGGEFCLAAEK